ncbi:MAG: FKBP12-associated protein [Claussenomyces sp. TS43310]|nr:MAG: FKBP12-associated protein [Claussenomyces sp. TS43310]
MATGDTESNTQKRSLQCDDECLRLQRNQKLASALNISNDHLDDHIPYSSTTLDLFKDQAKWAQAREKELRLFAADDSEKRLRFKPMASQQRAFLHSVAEDFGFDSESLDPEPHRHVSMFKTPRFVSAPMKTLAQCITIKAAPVVTQAPLKPDEPVRSYNALLLTSPRFDLTIDELHADLQNDLAITPGLAFSISFLPSEEIVVYPAPDSQLSGNDIESAFIRLKPLVTKTVLSKSLASSVMLCLVDHSLNVLRRDEDKLSAGGWSQVVKGASFKTTPQVASVGRKSAFTVLGSRMVARKPRSEDANVVEDWEMAADGGD